MVEAGGGGWGEVESLGLRAEAESGSRRLEAEVKDYPATVTMEDGRPVELAPYRWWAEGEQRGCQTDSSGGGRSGRVGGYSRASRLSRLPSGIRAHSWLDSGTGDVGVGPRQPPDMCSSL